MGRGKAKNMLNYSDMFAAADRKAENSQVCFRTVPCGNQQTCSIKVISTTSVTALAV